MYRMSGQVTCINRRFTIIVRFVDFYILCIIKIENCAFNIHPAWYSKSVKSSTFSSWRG